MSSKKKHGTHLFIDTNVLLNFYAYSKDIGSVDMLGTG